MIIHMCAYASHKPLLLLFTTKKKVSSVSVVDTVACGTKIDDYRVQQKKIEEKNLPRIYMEPCGELFFSEHVRPRGSNLNHSNGTCPPVSPSCGESTQTLRDASCPLQASREGGAGRNAGLKKNRTHLQRCLLRCGSLPK